MIFNDSDINLKGLEIPVPNNVSIDYGHPLQTNCDEDINDENQKVQVLPTVFKWDGIFFLSNYN